MGYWRRHQNKDLELVLMQFAEAGWRIDDSKGKYYKMYCPRGEHKTTLHLTPSDVNYAKNRIGYLKRHRSCTPKDTP